MNSPELNCPSCSQQYSEANPPRLLTMCGHTFCHHCIKSLITKKKDKGFKVKCPIDKTSMQMEKPNPSLFPKNIALITMLTKPKNSQSYNEFLSIDQMPNNIQQIESKQSFQEFHSPQKKVNPIEQMNDNIQKCAQHNKILQVFCVQEGEMICTDCALFSFHRSHQIKSIALLIKAQKEMVSHFQSIIKEKQEFQHKYLNKQVENEIFDLLDKKKNFMRKEIQSFFTKFHSILEHKQKQIEENLENKIMQMGERIQKKISKQFQNQKQYQTWYNQVQSIIDMKEGLSIHMIEKLRELVRGGFNEGKIEQGRLILKKIEFKEKKFMQNLEYQLEGLKFMGNNQQLTDCINSIILLSTTNQTQLQNEKYKQDQILPCQSKKDIDQYKDHKNQDHKNQDRKDQDHKDQEYKHHIYFNHQQTNPTQNKQSFCLPKFHNNQQEDEQILLDFTTPIQNNTKTPLTKTNSCTNLQFKIQQSPITKNKFNPKEQLSYKKSQIINQNIKTNQKKRPSSIDINSNKVVSSTSLQKSTVSKTNSKKKIQTKFTHQTLVQQILEDSLQTVDLTGQQINTQEMSHIVKAISQSQNVKNVKLMRNKLDDSFIQKHFKNLLNVEKLNLAQNKLSQQSVDKILSILKSETKYKLNYLNMGQNRIIDRKNRKLLEEFKNLKVNVVF